VFTSIGDAKIDPESIVVMWLFDEGKGDIAEDSSGKGNDGEITNDPKWVAGKIGNALEFDGVDDYVEVPDSDSLDVTEITIAAWVHPAKQGGEYTLLMKQNAFSWQMGGDGTMMANLYLGGAWHALPRYPAKTKIDPDTWSHVAYTYDGEKVRHYLNGAFNGEEAGTPGGDIGVSDAILRIGARTDVPVTDRPFKGIIDEFMILNEALTEADIRSIMTGATAVEPAGKLATTWAAIKAR